MPRRIIAALCVTAAVVMSVAPRAQDQTSEQQRQRFRSGAHYVRVDAYPVRDGRPIVGLSAADFELLEDGKPQAIDSVEFVQHPEWTPDARRRDPNSQRGGMELARDPAYRVFVLYLDAFHVDFSGSNRASRPIADLLNRMMGPQDLFGVLTPAQSVKDLLLGQLTQTIDEQLSKYPMWGLAGRLEPQPGEAELEFYFPDGKRLVALRRLDKVYGDLEGLIELLGDLREERKNIIYFSDSLASPSSPLSVAANADPSGRGTPPGIGVGPGGKLTMGSRNAGEPDRMQLMAERSRLLSIDFEQRFREVIQRARHANVSFYVVRPGGLDPAVSRMHTNVSNLEVLAEQTDGIAVLSSNNIREGMTKIAQDLSSHYVLGYYTSNTRWDGRTRKLTVRLKPSGQAVRARREYRAPTAAEMASISAARETTGSAPVASAIDTALSALTRFNPVPRFSAYATQAGGEVSVVAEIGAAEIEGGRWKDGAALQVLLSGPAGETVTATGRIEPGARGTLVPIKVAPGSGPWQAHVRIRGDGGAAESDTVAAERASGALIGLPTVYRAGSAAASPFRPASILYFRRTERVRFEWPVSTPLEDCTVRMLDRAGTPLTIRIAVAAPPSSGPQRMVADVNLAPLSNGDYLVEISGRAGDMSERHLTAIRVAYTR